MKAKRATRDAGGRVLRPRIPREYYLGPRYRVRVALVSQQVLAELQGGEKPGDGEADFLEGYVTYESGTPADPWVEVSIYIYDRLSLAKQWEVFRHEERHALNDVHDLDIGWERERNGVVKR